MPPCDLTLADWERFTDDQACRFALDVAARLPQPVTFVGLRSYTCAGRRLRVARFEGDDALFSLVPGGAVSLGYDGSRFEPGEAQLASYRDSAEEYGLPEAIRSFVEAVTTAPRTLTLSPILVEAVPWEIGLEPV